MAKLFNSPLLWDVFAISTYLTVSTVFWYIGLIPDFAMIRDRMSKTISPMKKKLYTLLAFGWSGRAKHWQRFEEVSLVLAGLATPLVFSVHTLLYQWILQLQLFQDGIQQFFHHTLCRSTILRICNGRDPLNYRKKGCKNGGIHYNKAY